MQKLSSSEIKQKMNNGETFLLDFYASWCGPCKWMMKTLEESEQSLNVPVYTFDVDSDQNFSREQGVRGVPTLKFIENGQIKNTKSGVMGFGQLQQFITS